MDVDGTARTDIDDALRYIAVVENDGARQESMVIRLLVKVVGLVQRRDLWPIIVGLADRLIAQGTIHDEEFYEYLERANCPNPFPRK